MHRSAAGSAVAVVASNCDKEMLHYINKEYHSIMISVCACTQLAVCMHDLITRVVEYAVVCLQTKHKHTNKQTN